MTDHKPGTFREPDKLPDSLEHDTYPLETESRDPAEMGIIRDSLNLNPDTVYYPCCGSDISPSNAFPNARVIYVDERQEVISLLRGDGYEAYHANALEFKPGEIDILFLSNPVITPHYPARFVRKGGYVICNNYHGTATYLREMDDFELVGAVAMHGEGQYAFETEDLGVYWEEIPFSSDDDFKALLPERYAMYQKLLATVGYPEMTILEGVKRGILARPRNKEYLILFVYRQNNSAPPWGASKSQLH